MGRPSQRDELPLNSQVSLKVFDKWAIDFIGPSIRPLGRKTRVKYIITTTKYLTRWDEAQPVKDFSAATTTKFIFEYILSQFGCPKILMSDRGSHFLNDTIFSLLEQF